MFACALCKLKVTFIKACFPVSEYMEEAFVSQDIKYDESVKSRMIVIPAQAGIQRLQMVLKKNWTPVFTGVTTFYEVVNFGECLDNQ